MIKYKKKVYLGKYYIIRRPQLSILNKIFEFYKLFTLILINFIIQVYIIILQIRKLIFLITFPSFITYERINFL